MLRLGTVAFALWLAAAVVFVACGTDDPSPETAADASFDPDALAAEGVCPAAAPADGEACRLPEGTTCAFEACGTSIAVCGRGVWRYGGNPKPQPACPEAPPTGGAACPVCWPADAVCRYGSADCSKPDASANQTEATCPAGTWVLAFSPCAVDAGADVQGDGGPEAD